MCQFRKKQKANVVRVWFADEWGFAEEAGEHILPFNFDIALSVVKESGDTIDEEIDEAVKEISGEKAFPCDSCEKICKSKEGTRHMNAKHKPKTGYGGRNVASSVAKLTKEELFSIVEKIKAKITKNGFWDDEVTADMASIKSNDTLYNHIQPVYERFCHKRNQDKFLMEFYELTPKSCGMLQCENQQICSLLIFLCQTIWCRCLRAMLQMNNRPLPPVAAKLHLQN